MFCVSSKIITLDTKAQMLLLNHVPPSIMGAVITVWGRQNTTQDGGIVKVIETWK